MARRRMIDPDFWLDEDLATLTPHARLLYIGLWNICDDNYATLPDRPEWIKAQIFPYESVTIPPLLSELSKLGKIIVFKYEGKKYWWIKNFFKHQRVEKPSKPKYPPYDDDTPLPLPDYSPTTPAKDKISKEKLREDKKREESEERRGKYNFLKKKEELKTKLTI